MKKVVRLTESQLVDAIRNIVTEDSNYRVRKKYGFIDYEVQNLIENWESFFEDIHGEFNADDFCERFTLNDVYNELVNLIYEDMIGDGGASTDEYKFLGGDEAFINRIKFTHGDKLSEKYFSYCGKNE